MDIRIAAGARLAVTSLLKDFQQPSAELLAVRSHVEESNSCQRLDLVFRFDGLQQLER